MEVKIIVLLFCHLSSSQSQLQPSFSPLSFLGNIWQHWSSVSRARAPSIFQPHLKSKLLSSLDNNFGDGQVRRYIIICRIGPGCT